MATLQEYVDKALDAYVQIEKAKAGAGLGATDAQQEAIRQPVRYSDPQAKAGAYVPGGSGAPAAISGTTLILLGAVAAAVYLAAR